MTPEERQNGVPITALREISILRSLRHSNVINVFDVAVGGKLMDEVYMVMDYAEHLGSPNQEFTLKSLRVMAHLAGLFSFRLEAEGVPVASGL